MFTNLNNQILKETLYGKRKTANIKHVCRFKRKQGVWWSSNGFTLVEMLIVLAIFFACAASFPLLYDSLYRTIESGKTEKNTEWELFVIQLRNELHMSKDWHVMGRQLRYFSLEENDSMISISKYEDKIRRQVNGKGHEIMLQNVKSADFSLEGGKVYIHVTFSNGEKEGASVSPFYTQAAYMPKRHDLSACSSSFNFRHSSICCRSGRCSS